MINRYKYPRTPHLPWSLGTTNDDKILTLEDTLKMFSDKRIVITEKMDGENITMYRDGIHARSIDSGNHPSRDYVKQLHGSIAHLIPEGWRICGENFYAKHSIHYNDLRSYFYVFSVWNNKNICLGWNDTVKFCYRINLELVNVWAETIWPKDHNFINPHDGPFGEGYVIRNADTFHYDDFSRNVAKYVRANHVLDNDIHWTKKPLVKNLLLQDN